MAETTTEELPIPATATQVQTESSGIRVLTPANTEIFRSDHGLLEAIVAVEETGTRVRYPGVFAVLAFPVSCPDSFLSLRYFRNRDREEEIGIIEDPMAFPDETRKLLAKSLQGHYFEFKITRVLSVEHKWGLLLFDVDTLQGRRQFEMNWRHDCAQSLGRRGKVLLDVHNNRFVVENMGDLSAEDGEKLTRYIYW